MKEPSLIEVLERALASARAGRHVETYVLLGVAAIELERGLVPS